MANPNPGTLYVFLHGLTVINKRSNDVEIVLPRVRGHSFKAGSFLTETPIKRKAQLRLEGVKRGGTKFPDTDYILHLAGYSVTRRRRAATLWLPFPKHVLELLRVDNFPNLVTTKNGALSFSREANAVVLVYDYDDENQVFLENHYWEPLSNDGSISLHIVATSEGPEGRAHEIESEKALSKVIRNYPGLTFKKPAQVPPPWNAPTNPNGTPNPSYPNPLPSPPLPRDQLAFMGEFIVVSQSRLFAFAQAELEPVDARAIRVGRLGRLKQQGRPLQNLWQTPDSLGQHPCNCGGIVLP